MEFVFETEEDTSELESIVEQFIKALDPVESEALLLFKDECTGAIYTECHIAADTIFQNSTDDVPLDPDASSEYRANRQLVDDHAAYKQMEADALKGRSFSNFVCEFIPVICPLLSGPKLMIFWITKEIMNAEQEASPGRDYREAA